MTDNQQKAYELVDTHCHLYLEQFRQDLPAVMQRAEEAGVVRFYLPGLDRAHFEAMTDLERAYPGCCFAMAGIHPCYVNENWQAELDFLREQLKLRSFAAIGEIGLDYYWSREFDESQKIVFAEQIELAQQYKLPIVIHSRNSMDDTIAMLREHHQVRGIFHCFSGTVENAEAVIECGMVLGIGGVVTYKNAGLDKVIEAVPLDKIVLETDAPYLTPVPFRGKRNESSYLSYIVARIAEIKRVSPHEVAGITTSTANSVFGFSRTS